MIGILTERRSVDKCEDWSIPAEAKEIPRGGERPGTVLPTTFPNQRKHGSADTLISDTEPPEL